MAKKIQFDKLAEGSLFRRQIQDGETLIKVIRNISVELKKSAAESKEALGGAQVFGSAADIQRVEKEIKKVNESVKAYQSTREKQIQTEKKVQQLTEEEIKDRLRLQKVQKEQRDRLKILVAEEDKEIGTLKKLELENKKLRIEREKLNLDTNEGRLRLRQINAELDKNNKFIKANSDQLKQQRLNVGNYSDSIKEAAESSGLFGGVLGRLTAIQRTANALLKIVTAQKQVDTAAEIENTAATVANSEAETVNTGTKIANTEATIAGAEATEVATVANSKFTRSIRLIGTALKASGLLLLIAALGSVIAFFKKTQDGADQLELVMAKVGAVIDVLIDRIAKAGPAILNIFKTIGSAAATPLKIIGALSQALRGDFSDALESLKDAGKDLANVPSEIGKSFSEIGSAFDGFGKAVQENIDLITKLKEAEFELRDITGQLIVQRAKYREEIAALRLEAEQEGKSTRDRITLLKEANALEEELAARTQDVIVRRFAQAAQIDDLAKAQALLNKISREGLDLTRDEIGRTETMIEQLNEAREIAAEYVNAQEEAFVRQKENQTKIRKLTEKEAAELLAIQDKLNQNRIAQIKDAEDKELELEEVAFEKSKREIRERGKEFGFEQAIVDKQIESELELHQFRKLEIERKYFLQREKERIAAEKSIRTLQNSLEQEEIKGQIGRITRQVKAEEQAILDARKEGLQASSDQLKELTEEEFDLRKSQLIQQASFELKDAEGSAAKQKVIRQKLKNDLEALEHEKGEAILKIQKDDQKAAEDALNESLDRQRQQFQDAIEAFTDAVRKAGQERIDALDQEISDVEKRQDQLRELAERGSQDATDNLAFEQRREAQLRAEKEKEIQRQKRVELGLTALNTFNAKVQSRDENPLGSTIKDIGLLVAFINSIPAFYEGTERVTGKGNLNVGRDNHLIRVDGDERVMDAENNRKTGFMDNDALGDLAMRFRRGDLMDASAWVRPPALSYRFESADSLLKSIDQRLANLPGQIDIPHDGYRYNEFERAMIHTIRRRGKTVRNHHKTGRLFE